MRAFLVCALLFFGFQVHATELNPGTIVGHYKVSADVGFQKVYLNFHVIDGTNFEIQRVHPNGKQDEVCAGTYGMNAQLYWTDVGEMAANKIFKGVFTCPSKPGKNVDFNIDFKDRTTEDLTNGTTVTVTSSLAPGYAIDAFVKKQ